MFYVYAISSIKRSYIYVGLTHNVIRRFWQHNKGCEKTTKPYCPFILIFSVELETRQIARETEKYYKSTVGKRKLKEKLNQQLNLQN